jgi:pimeloyl-ACP methyl ester carboxylesterase
VSSVHETHSVRAPDGRTLTLSEGGDPDGVPVLVHVGTPSGCLPYQPHLEDAARRGIRLIAYDRPGYGGSTRKAGRNVADCTADVVAICDALGIERFCAWGVSGGGPHVLATAAFLAERCVAVASLASIAPIDAEGLDFTAGMGKSNVESFEAVLAGEETHRARHEQDLQDLLGTTPERLVEVWGSLLGPADREVATGEVATFLLDNATAAVTPSSAGWFDDDIAFSKPWGFEVSSIQVPVLLMHGEQDLFVPYGHGLWLAEHIPEVDARLSAEDGHLTLPERRIGEVHAWLVERFVAGGP